MPGGLHGAGQVALALVFTAPLVAKASEFADRPTAAAAVGVIEVSAIWALLALIGWAARVTALSSCGRWGQAARRRVRRRQRGLEEPH